MGIWENIYTNHPTAIAGFTALIVAIIGIIKQRQTSKEKNSLDFEANYKNNNGIRQAWDELHLVLEQKPAYLIEIAKDRNNKHRKSIILILNEWERAASAIYHNLYDENLIYKAYGTTVIKLFCDTSIFIAHFQNKNPRLFVSFTKLAIRWQLKRAKEYDLDILKELSGSLRELHTASTNLNLSLLQSTVDNKRHYLLSPRRLFLRARKAEFKRLFRKLK